MPHAQSEQSSAVVSVWCSIILFDVGVILYAVVRHCTVLAFFVFLQRVFDQQWVSYITAVCDFLGQSVIIN